MGEKFARGVSVGARPLVGTDATRDRRCRWDRSLCLFPSSLLLPPPLTLPRSFVLSRSLSFPRERDTRTSYWLIVRARDRNRRGLVIAAARVFHSKFRFPLGYDIDTGYLSAEGGSVAAALRGGFVGATRHRGLFRCYGDPGQATLFYEAIFI